MLPRSVSSQPPSRLPTKPPWPEPSVVISPRNATREPDAERREADERAAEEHQPADGDERRRSRVRGAAQEVAEPLLDLLADDPAGEAQIEQRGEEETERGEPEPDQLGVLVRRSGARLLSSAS